MVINVKFENLKCVVKSGKSEQKTILDSVNGTFTSGQLTCILGASGSGKTTLLNIIGGYLSVNVTGNIYVNQIKKNSSDLKRISTYITQDILVQPFLTVLESLMIAADLKLNGNKEFKKITVQRIVTTLGLRDCLGTRSEYLSGGEKKKLSIALELISDPLVIFLDEPTTGLDEVAMKMCIDLLKNLANGGKTVVCSMHQPSDSALRLFDHLYFLDNGYCIYDGTVDGMVPFLSIINFHCPTTYNPADYILEITQNNKENSKLLRENAKYLPNDDNYLFQFIDEISDSNVNKHRFYYDGPTFWTQICILLQRSFLQLCRNKYNIFLQCFHFTLCGLLIGGTFMNVGQDAKYLFHNFMLGVIILVYLIFSCSLPIAVAYPLEFKLFKNELSNGWYDVNTYYIQLSLVALPIPIVMSIVFTVITYCMTNQPMEFDRFIKICIIMIITAVISESHGKVVGICCDMMTYGALFTPGSLVPVIALSFYGFGYARYLNDIVKIIMQFSFIRYSLVGFMVALYNNREKIECSDIYCHYNEPALFLDDMGMEGCYEIQISVLIAFLILYRCTIYVFLRTKLSRSMKLY